MNVARAFYCGYSSHRISISTAVVELSLTEAVGFELVLVAIAGFVQALSVKNVLCISVSEFSEQSSFSWLW